MKKRVSFILSLLLIVVLSVTAVPTGFAVSAAKKSSSQITLNYSTYTLKKGGTVKLKAKTKSKSKTVVFTSKNPKIATVNSKGEVVAKKKGKTTITAKIKGTKQSAKCTIIVGTPVKSVSVKQKSVTLKVGESLKISPKVKPSSASNKKLSYKSNKGKIVSVNKKGVMHANAIGNAKITVSSTDGSKKEAKITVKVISADVMVSSVSINPQTVTIEKGKTEALTASVLPAEATNKALVWTSDNEAVATVSENGQVTGVNNGTANITATTQDGSKISVTSTVTVVTKVQGITISADKKVVKSGENLKLSADITPEDATDKTITWTSSDTNIATVSSDGTVEGIVTGKVTITAAANDGSDVSGSIDLDIKGAASEAVLDIKNTDIVAGVYNSNKAVFYVEVNGNKVESVELYDAANNLVGNMVDDGKYSSSGDDMAGDGIFTFSKTYTSNESGEFTYHALVKTATNEITSNTKTLNVIAEMSSDKRKQMDDADSTIKTAVSAFTNDKKSNVTAAKKVLDELKQQGTIKEVGNYKNGEDVYPFVYTDGTLGGIALEPMTDATDGVDAASREEKKGLLNSLMKEVVVVGGASGNTKKVKAGVFFGFENTQFRTSFYNSMGTEWNNLGISYNQPDATIANLKNIQKYDLIIFSMHGSRYNGDSVFCTNEIATKSKDKTYYADINNNRVVRVICQLDGDSAPKTRYWVKPEFFSANYSSNSLAGKIVFAQCCMSMGESGTVDYKMANTFIGIGAETYVGYHNSVYSEYGRNVMKLFGENLVNGMNAEAALNNATSKYGSNDGGSPAAYPILVGKKDASFIVTTNLINGSFEEAPMYKGWDLEGDTRLLLSLSDVIPQDGTTMAIITTGIGSKYGDYNGTEGSYIRQDFIVPNNASTISFDYDCVSEEPMEFVGSQFDDQFAAYLLDSDGNTVSEMASEAVNSSKWIELGGVDFDGGDASVYHTGWKKGSYNISAYRGKKVTVLFKVWDVGDSRYDTAGVIDNVIVK